MSSTSSVVTAEHFAYVRGHTRGDDAFLQRLKAAAAAAGIPEIQISPEQASFMQVLLKLRRAEVVVEVGTLAGYSAIAMARALPPSGKVHTIEIEAAHVDFARRWVADSDVAGRVEVHHGPGARVLATFAAGSADACFIDADKGGYPTYVDECLRILRPGGLLMVDNAFAFGQLLDPRPTETGVAEVRRFNEYMAGVAGVHAVIVPIGDGCWVGVKE